MVGAYLALLGVHLDGDRSPAHRVPGAIVMFLGGMLIYELGVRFVLQAPPVKPARADHTASA